MLDINDSVAGLKLSDEMLNGKNPLKMGMLKKEDLMHHAYFV